MTIEFEEDDWADAPPSKSALKRVAAAQKDLADELMALNDDQLTSLDLPSDLLEAVRLGRAITAHGGLRRQRKFIGKLLRGLDTAPIRAGLQRLGGESAEAVRLLHQVERWRDRMLTDGDPAINEFVGLFPDTDRQKLRQLVRDAQRQHAAGQPPRAARLLFKAVREGLAGSDQDGLR